MDGTGVADGTGIGIGTGIGTGTDYDVDWGDGFDYVAAGYADSDH